MLRGRYQNPVLGDSIELSTYIYSSNQRANIAEVLGVDIYYLDPEQKTDQNLDGRVLLESIPPTKVTNPQDGHYSAVLETDETSYRIGNYIDRWSLLFEDTDNRPGIIENKFVIYRDLWHTTPVPLVHNVSFQYNPHKLIQYSKKYIRVDLEVYPERRETIEEFYHYLSSTSPVTVRIIQDEGEGYDRFDPSKNIVYDWQQMQFRDQTTAYFLLDSSIDPRPNRNGKPLGKGIYLVQFKASIGETEHLSPRYRLQIYD